MKGLWVQRDCADNRKLIIFGRVPHTEERIDQRSEERFQKKTSRPPTHMIYFLAFTQN